MLEFDRAAHRYTLDGQPVPHVTQVTDALSSYYGVPADVLQRKAEIGDAVHYACELHDQGDLDEASLPAEIRGYVAAWQQFRRQTGFAPTYIEQPVASAKYRYAGTLDRLGVFHRHARVRPIDLCLLDLKTTFSILPAVGPQTAAYAHAWNESLPPSQCARHRFAVQLKPDGGYRLHHCTDASDLSVFLSALSLVNWKRRHNLETTA